MTHKTELVVVDKAAHQFALFSSKSNRLKVIDCIIRAWGADTVSPWNAQAGMYYFKDCILQGGTDFYCPRGWAYADNCTFVCLQPSAAAIWHDGHADKSMKNVLVNCHFKGDKPYKLGRYHHDALFYLVSCTFDANLKDLPIYKAETAKEVFWGQRAYFYNCSKQGAAYAWLNNNLDQSPGAPDAKNINAKWTFNGKWDPTK
jgi:pectinesterase